MCRLWYLLPSLLVLVASAGHTQVPTSMLPAGSRLEPRSATVALYPGPSYLLEDGVVYESGLVLVNFIVPPIAQYGVATVRCAYYGRTKQASARFTVR